jgi:hypothetical protein
MESRIEMREVFKAVIDPSIPSIGKFDYEHHALWNYYHPEDPVKRGEVVHHINGNHDDNTPSNLQKMSWSAHAKLSRCV